jgi:hypothetical protein
MEEQAEILLSGRLDGMQRNKLKRLLDMFYTPRELAEEIGVNVDRVYMVYVPGGCPHERDEQRHIWINGKSFRRWFEETYAKRDLKTGEAFCKTCKHAVMMVNPIRKQKDQLIYGVCKCPKCGRGLVRIIDYHRKRQ